MEVGETKTLNKDARFAKSFWAKKGTKIKILTISGNAVTVEDSRGRRFPCNIKDLE